MMDRFWSKARGVRGEKNGNSKLTKEQVLEIRKLFAEKQFSQSQLARMFNISYRQINTIVNRKSWAWL